MAKYINVDALGIGKARRDVFNDPAYADGWNSAIEIMQNAPAADVAPVVHAHWEEKIIDDSNPLFRRRFYCSACRDWQTYGKTNHCPTCGARMDESEEEDNA